MHLEGLYVLLVWSVADFSSCQGNNSIKKLILSGLNCNIVFSCISLITMFTNKAQGSWTDTNILIVNVVYLLSEYDEHRKTNETKA